MFSALKVPVLGEFGVFQVLAALVALLAIRQYLRLMDFWKKRGVPYKPGLPLIGSSSAFFFQTEYRGITMQRFYSEARAKGQPCLGLFVGFKPMLLLADIELVKAVMVKDFSHFMDRPLPYDREKEPLTANLLALKGTEWRSLRHKLTPTFTSGRMRAMYPLVQACTEELQSLLAAEAAKGEPVEMMELFARFTTDVIGSCAFGIQANALKDPEAEFRRMGRKAFDLNVLQTLFSIVLPDALPLVKKFFPVRLLNKKVDSFFTGTFEENVKYRQKNKVERHDFVDLLMQLKKRSKGEGQDVGEGDGIDADLLPGQAFVFFLAGFETSSSALGNAMTELAHNPDVQDKVRAELQRVLAKHDGKLSYEAMQELTYMEKVIDETMRLYPAASNMARVVTEDYELPLGDNGGKTTVLPKGMKVLVPTFAIHRDPEFYPNPDKFNPENFSDEAKRSRPNFAFMPFGEGPRICIGMRFAMMQMKAGLGTILRDYRVLPVEGINDYPARFVRRAFVTKVEGGNRVLLRPL